MQTLDSPSLSFLVVDDEPSILDALTFVLEGAYSGAQVRSAHSNDEAFRILQQFRPALITTDINRPGGNGFDFLESLRVDPQTSRIPVIAVSAMSTLELDLYRVGFNGVLVKPFMLEKLIEAVNRVLHVNADPDTAVICAGVENPVLDYKESLDLSTREGRATLAKDVIAMANYGGGTMVIGVAEKMPGKFVPVGLTPEQVNALEVTRVNRALGEYIDPIVHVSVKRARLGTREFVILRVPGATDTLLLAVRQNDVAGLYPGRIYTRNNACESAEIRDSSELRSLLARLNRDTPRGAVYRS